MDRREQIEEWVAEFADRLGMSPPLTVLVEGDPLGIPIWLYSFELNESKQSKKLDLPELRVTPEAFELSSAEVRYRIAQALYDGTPEHSRAMTRTITWMTAPTVIVIFGSVALSFLHDWKWLFGILIGFAIVPLAVLILIVTMEFRALDRDKLAIRLTGDRQTGLEILRKGWRHRMGRGPFTRVKRLQRLIRTLPD